MLSDPQRLPWALLAEGGLSVSGLSIPLGVALLVVSVLGYALVNSIEIAVVAVNRIRIHHLAEQGSHAAQSLERLRESQDRFFAVIVLIQNLFVVLASSMASIIAVELAGGVGIVIATVVVTLVIALFGEVTPKTLAAQAGERYALLVARPAEWLLRALAPLATAMAAAPRLLSRAFLGGPGAITPTVTEAELRMLIDISTEEGAVAESTGELLERVFHFRERLAHEVMVPRTEVVWLERGTSLTEFYRVYQEASHSRFPVYDDTMDNAVGVIGIKDVLRGLASGELDLKTPIDRVMRPAYFVPETKDVGRLFWEMQQRGHQLAVVVDEYGGTAGIVTLELLLEEIVGKVADELGRPQPEFEAIDERTAQVDGGMSVRDANEELGLSIPEGDYETVAGFVLGALGHIPKEGEQVQGDGFRMTVAEMHGVKIERVLVTRTEA